MDIRHLECYKAVVEEGSILKASLKLNISQPPLSRMMKQLEEELETTLFLRGKKIELTKTGKLLYERACSILSLKENTLKEIKNLDLKNEITLNLGIVSSSTELLYQNTLQQFHKENPNVRFRIHEANTYQLIELLKQKVIDLAIVRTPFDASAFQSVFFKEEPMVLLSLEDIFKHEITIQDLNQKPIIYYRRFKEIIAKLFKEEAIELNCIAEVDDAKTAILLASTGLGYSLVPKSAYQTFSHLNLYAYPLNHPDLKTRLGLIYRKEETIKPIYYDFISSLKQNA